MQKYDLIIVGAGMSGLCMLHKALQLGLSAIALEAGDGVGGAWYWNKYPGCRCDVDSIEYSFSFSEELQQDWTWSEKMAGQAEIERYLNHVADRFELREHIEFGQFVNRAQFDDGKGTWQISTEQGFAAESQFLVMASGSLSVPNFPKFEGADRFAGDVYHTALWPSEPADLSDKHVGVIGSGSSGVQLIQTIAAETKSLTTFQRSPAYTFPANNKALDEEYVQSVKENYSKIRDKQRKSDDGLSAFQLWQDGENAALPSRKLLPLTPEQRKEEIEQFGLTVLLAYADVNFNEEADEIAKGLYRDYLFEKVKDPRKAEALLPADVPLRCKRPVLDTNYYETFNNDHVDIVRLTDDNPITEITQTGLRTAKEEYQLDALIYATGFDAITGPMTRIDICNGQGQSVKQVWDEEGIQSFLGLQVSGFPNLFTITGLGSPSVLSNLAFSIEYHVNWIGDCLTYLRENKIKSIEARKEKQEQWAQILNESAAGRLMVAPSCNSWYLGSNIPGKERKFLIYTGGCRSYDQHCRDAASKGYQAFNLVADSAGR